MLPVELNIIPIAVIALVLIFYAILLVKLKPSKETELTLNGYPERKKEAPIELKRPEKPTKPAETNKTTDAKQALPVKTQISTRPPETSKEPATKVENITAVQTEAPVGTAEAEEKQRIEKDKEAKKSFLLFGERNFEGCPHKFGYLSNLPKNTPIPNECFGCPRIVECLRTSKSK